MPKCEECRHCVMIEHGYSNWTVEGVDVYCDLNAHPNTPFDNWYGQDKEHAYANQCDLFSEGYNHVMDVDGDVWRGDEEEVGWWEACVQRHPDWFEGRWIPGH